MSHSASEGGTERYQQKVSEIVRYLGIIEIFIFAGYPVGNQDWLCWVPND